MANRLSRGIPSLATSLLVVLGSTIACSSGESDGTADPTGESPQPNRADRAQRRELARGWESRKLESLEGVETTDSPAQTGEVPPELLAEIIDQAAATHDVDRAVVEIVRSEATVWSDGSLGCPEPGQVYTQQEIKGYWVVLRVGTELVDYRATETGTYRKCDSSDHRVPESGTSVPKS